MRKNRKLLNKERIRWLKKGVVIVNLSSRNLVDERIMNQALTARDVDSYCFEDDGFGKSPLKGNEYCLMPKRFSTNTIETKEKNQEAMVDNIENIARGRSYNKLDF